MIDYYSIDTFKILAFHLNMIFFTLLTLTLFYKIHSGDIIDLERKVIYKGMNFALPYIFINIAFIVISKIPVSVMIFFWIVYLFLMLRFGKYMVDIDSEITSIKEKILDEEIERLFNSLDPNK